MEIIETQVLVIGGGGAAARAALEASAGADVLMVMKGKFGQCGATAYKTGPTAGFSAADGMVDFEDCPREHLTDILNAGLGMADRRLGEILAVEAPQMIPFLEGLSVQFEKLEGKYLEVLGCFATRPRMHIIRGHSEPILAALKNEILRKPQICLMEDSMVVDLLVREGVCFGASVIDQSGHLKCIQAPCVILATGGIGQLFHFNLNPPDITGDGFAIAYRAGLDLIHMEFMQSVLGIVHPSFRIINPWAWYLKPTLINNRGENFLQRYLPDGVSAEQCVKDRAHHAPFSTRDNSRFIDISIKEETLKGNGTARNGIFLDFRGANESLLSQEQNKLWNITKEWIRSQGVDVDKQPLEASCFAHAMNGGIRINENGGTSFPGIFAVGEVDGGAHGADRLGGNMIVHCQVFGARAGKSAGEQSRMAKPRFIPARILDKEKAKIDGYMNTGENVPVERGKLRKTLWENLLVIRSEKMLQGCLYEIQRIRETFQGPRGSGKVDLWQNLELRNMLDTAELMSRAALLRNESRGGHFRKDFPKRNDEQWSQAIVLRRDNDRMGWEFIKI